MASRAFFDDPFFRYLLPTDVQRSKGLEYVFRTTLAHLGPRGQTVTARDEDRIVGVAAWLPPNCYPQPVATQLAQIPGTVRGLIRRPRALREGSVYMRSAARTHSREPFWYLLLLAVEPSLQRSGVGTMLLEPTLAQVDAEGAPSHLETQKEENLTYYRRFGYDLYSTLKPVPEGPALYMMWRPPH